MQQNQADYSTASGGLKTKGQESGKRIVLEHDVLRVLGGYEAQQEVAASSVTLFMVSQVTGLA